MTDSYTVFWTPDRLLGAVAVGRKPLPVLFAGPNSEPSFRRAGVTVGDTLYPIAVSNRRVLLIARMRVREILLLGQQDGPALIDQRFPQYRAWKALAPTCTEEVIVGMEGTVPRADLELPPEVLGRLTFRSQRGERPLKQVRDGELTSSVGLQGIYRLTPASTQDLDHLLAARTPAHNARTPRSERRTAAAAEDALF